MCRPEADTSIVVATIPESQEITPCQQPPWIPYASCILTSPGTQARHYTSAISHFSRDREPFLRFVHSLAFLLGDSPVLVS